MTDKTDALLALADEMVQVLAQTPAREMSRTHDVIGGWQRALRALAEQPANCTGCEGSPAEGNNPCAVCGRTTPPAASVDLEQFREACECMKLWYAGRWTPVCPEKRAIADRLLALIDSAGGAKGGVAVACTDMGNYTDYAFPQPDDGDEAVVSHHTARVMLDSLDDYARMNTGVDARGPRETLERYIAQQEARTSAAAAKRLRVE